MCYFCGLDDITRFPTCWNVATRSSLEWRDHHHHHHLHHHHHHLHGETHQLGLLPLPVLRPRCFEQLSQNEISRRPPVIRPPDIHCTCRRTYVLPGILSFFFLSFFFSFFRQLAEELADRNSTTSGHMARSKCNLKMHVRNLGYPSPTNRGPKTTIFGDFAT